MIIKSTTALISIAIVSGLIVTYMALNSYDNSWESGKTNSIIMYANSTIISIEEIDHPASIRMIDKDGCAYYDVNSLYLSLDELKRS